jgi:hypothetical protein
MKICPVPYMEGYVCPLFSQDSNRCGGYDIRPFDCQLYPFILTFNRDYNKVCLSVDVKCPFIREHLDSVSVKEYTNYLANFLEGEDASGIICANPGLITPAHPDLIPLAELGRISGMVCLIHLGFRKFSWEARPSLEVYFKAQNSPLSVYSFVSIFIWSELLNFTWKLVDGCLCIIAESGGEYFLYLPPVSLDNKNNGLKEVTMHLLEVLKGLNRNGSATRIENVSQGTMGILSTCGLKPAFMRDEYLCNQKDLSSLAGNRYKGKRSACNYFATNYKYSLRPFELRDMTECLALYKRWAEGRMAKTKDEFYNGLLCDSLLAQLQGMQYYGELELKGLVLTVEDKIIGYTFGFELNRDVFCVLFETVDLAFKGAPAFLSMKFCQELKKYKYVNLMDDSGLTNLRKHKLSYHPAEIHPCYTLTL